MTMAEVHEIIDIALEVNGLGVRDKKTTGSLPTVFVDMSGHVACLEIRVHENGWDYNYADKTFKIVEECDG